MADKLGLKQGARNPASLANLQHHDASSGQKNISASPSSIKSVLPAANTTSQVVDQESVIRAYNNAGAVAFIWVGEQGSEPVTVDATTGIPLAPNAAENFLVGGSSNDMKSMMVKTSAATVLVLQYKSIV